MIYLCGFCQSGLISTGRDRVYYECHKHKNSTIRYYCEKFIIKYLSILNNDQSLQIVVYNDGFYNPVFLFATGINKELTGYHYLNDDPDKTIEKMEMLLTFS